MTTRLTFPASMFSVVCQRCGSTVRKNADSCPNCGADRSAAFGQTREAASGKSRKNVFEEASAPLASAGASASGSSASLDSDGAGRVEPGMRSRWTERASERIAQKAAEYRARRAEESARNAFADSSNDPDALPGSERWNTKKTVIAGACGLVLLLGATFYYQLGDSDGGSSTPSADHSVSGVIDSKVGSLMRGATDAPGTPAAPAAADRRPLAAAPSGNALQDVRVALDQHDLATARARLKMLPPQQQARADYESLKDELVKREAQRDAALQLARACERTSAWACVQQNAGEALALDGSNIESQAMLERVISHAGWLAPTAVAALAKRVPGTAPAADAANTAAAAPAQLPAQANVAAAAAQAAKTNGFAQKPTPDRRTVQRSTAARWADDDAAYESRAEKIARGQAATAAITATTINPPPAPTVATTMTMPTPAPQAATQPTPQPTPLPTPQPATTQAAVPAPSQPAAAKAAPPPVTQAARAPYYLGEESAQPSAANSRAANPRAPYYIGDEPPQQAARPANPRGAYYLGEDPPQPSAPPTRTAVPHPPQSANQSSALPPSTAPMQAAVPRPPAAVAQAVAQPVVQTNVATRSTQAAATTGASPQFATVPAGSHVDSDKSEELERAIKQYGWSGGDSASKPPSR
ncbi:MULTISPECIES: zinc ribbon domain-containing protein [Caballeronia]|uniref:zinc ribbon domain-containing protein n=1 Tax=Caballeronia TaxID=1827195 RepID=UPI001588F586|nr:MULTISPECIES: zinc ribbon domain-containing protein [Caballeronia]MCG7399925.1 zinc ribbon domain-containing protein [Caballeronia zhejiangensis]MCI1043604.1 zinc ribbon domain-containing protein [Caballeronia zhejiangensis]